MTYDEVNNLGLGVYRLYWKDGGSSVASVGMRYDGTRWFMPSNWSSVTASSDWFMVKHAELIAKQHPEPGRYDSSVERDEA